MKDVTDLIKTYDEQGIQALLNQGDKAISLSPADEPMDADVQKSLHGILNALKQEEISLTNQQGRLMEMLEQADKTSKACLSYLETAKNTQSRNRK